MRAFRNVLTLLFVFMFLNSQAQKQALVIGIGEYPKSGKWPRLSSENDLKYAKGILKHLGFDKEQINVLKNEAATKDNIVQAFNELTLNTQPGDFVFIHYSGHGQQVIDDNNDEIDKLDEAIVPYDSPLEYQKGVYEGENLIRDDQLNQITQKLRAKVGTKGQVVLIMDSCHSGTGTRGFGSARGSSQIMGPSGQFSTSKATDYGMVSMDEKGLAPMACFFGSSAQELNYETFDTEYNSVGSLTYALSDVINNLKGKCTFRELFERVKLKMAKLAPNQNPKWEGPSDVIFMENSKMVFDQWVGVVNHFGDQEMIIGLGTLAGVFPGSKLTIHDAQSEKVLSKATVINSQLVNSIVRLENSIPVSEKIFKAKIVQKTNPPCKVVLSNQIEEGHAWNKVIDELDESKICSFSNAAADLYIANCGTEDDKIQLSTKEGDIIYEGTNHEKTGLHLYKINQHIKSYSLGQYIRQFDFKSDELNFEVEVVPVQVEKKGRKVISQEEARSHGKMGDDGFLHFKNGDYIMIRVKNKGSKGAYFSVLDIQGDNRINFVVPSRGNNLTSEDYYLKPGETYETDFPIRIAPPFGNELIKLIASDQPLDLENAIGGNLATRGIDNPHPFESFLDEFATQSRAAGKAIDIEALGTADFLFRIVN